MAKVYSIFGAGAAGLYTAWRLMKHELADPQFASRELQPGDVLELYDWGRYNFSPEMRGTRSAGARICTWFYQDKPGNSYLELGGMRYSHWDRSAADQATAPGHRLVTTVIHDLGLDPDTVPFNVTNNQLFYLRSRNFYLNDISSSQPAPYAVNNFGASTTPDAGFGILEDLAVPRGQAQTRRWWCNFYNTGTIQSRMPDSSVFQQGDRLRDIGYWNLLYDQLGSEGYDYAADGNGYSSNVINTHAGVSISINDEFAPGTQYRTLSSGYSSMFNALFDTITKLAHAKGIEFRYRPDTRLHSILWKAGKAVFTTATRENPMMPAHRGEADAAWLAMPRAAIDLVAQATRFAPPADGAVDVLNHDKVALYLESVIMQPSYKVGMFFSVPWWSPEYKANLAPYPAQIIGFVSTPQVVAKLRERGFPPDALDALGKLDYQAFTSIDALVRAVEAITNVPLTIPQTKDLATYARRDTIGPSATNSPVRMVVYFGNNARDQTAPAVYGILASYDDEDNAYFWRELELGPDRDRVVPVSSDTQPIDGPRKVPPRMVKFLRKMLAELHFGPNADYTSVPEPLDAAYIDWSLPPFNAGYHEYAPHYDIRDVQRGIRKPSQLIEHTNADIFIVGEAYSNDQAWVEGAYCTAESVLNDFFGIKPLVDNIPYPFICPPENDR
ncbi:MAG TPA: hypothetical protein VFP84_35590 [Kofleriaceae bacterium]|nr:hypothetical protein [Kofleriaceae bacterium]